MQPMRPEGGGRPPQAPKPIRPDITEILTHEEAPLTPDQQRKKRRTIVILSVLSIAFVILAVFLTVHVVKMLAALS